MTKVLKCQREDRFVIDYRILIQHTAIPLAPFPDVRSCYDSMAGCSYFSIIDLRSGYHQILVDEPTSELLAFATPIGTFKWKVMPFGPSGAPTYCHAEMSHWLRDRLFKRLGIWIDDIIIGGETRERCIELTNGCSTSLKPKAFTPTLKNASSV